MPAPPAPPQLETIDEVATAGNDGLQGATCVVADADSGECLEAISASGKRFALDGTFLSSRLVIWLGIGLLAILFVWGIVALIVRKTRSRGVYCIDGGESQSAAATAAAAASGSALTPGRGHWTRFGKPVQSGSAMYDLDTTSTANVDAFLDALAAMPQNKPLVMFVYGNHCGACQATKPHMAAAADATAAEAVDFLGINLLPMAPAQRQRLIELIGTPNPRKNNAVDIAYVPYIMGLRTNGTLEAASRRDRDALVRFARGLSPQA
jgi:thiol-disulfide isomerase/thioredoxin